MEQFKLPNINEEQTALKTVRIRIKTLNKLNEVSKESNISVNRLINECIEFALNHLYSEKEVKKKIKQ